MGDGLLDGFAEKKIDSCVVVGNNTEDDVGDINEICVGNIEEGNRGR